MQPIVIVPSASPELASAPIPQDWVLSGTPEARSRQLARSSDRASSVMAWSCTAGRFNWHYTVDETVHIIAGEVFVTDENGREHRLGPGDSAFFPAGSRSTWYVPTEVRKVAVCRQSMPFLFAFALRAWNMMARFMGTIFRPGEETADPLASAAPAAKRAAELGRARGEA
jgi:uncharacterized protein